MKISGARLYLISLVLIAAIIWGALFFLNISARSTEGALVAWTGVLAISTIVLALGTMALGYFGFRADQANTENSKRQLASEAVASHITALQMRAYIGVSPSSAGYKVISANPVVHSNVYNGAISISNYGRVPAEIQAVNLRVACGSQPNETLWGFLSAAVVAEGGGSAAIGRLSPGEAAYHHLELPVNTQAKFVGFFYVWGEVIYLDGFAEQPRRLRFAHRYYYGDALASSPTVWYFNPSSAVLLAAREDQLS